MSPESIKAAKVKRTQEWWKNRQKLAAKSDPDPTATGGWDLLQGSPEWTRANEIWQQKHARELEQEYEKAVIVYACVKRICIAAQEAPLRYGEKTDDGWENLDGDALQSLLSSPNSQMSDAEFEWHLISHLLLTGETYIWKWRDGLNQVAEMWPIPTSWVTKVLDQAGRLIGFSVWQGADRQKFVAKKDMIRIILPQPASMTSGLGPLQAAGRDVQTDEARGDYIVEMLENARTPGMILTQPAGWSPEQKDEIRAMIMNGLGRGRRGRPLFMEGDGAKLEQTAPLKDLDWPGMSALSETRICAAFGVPPIIIGLRSGLESATYSNFAQAMIAFMQGTMVPLWNWLDNGLTRGLLRDEGVMDERKQIYHDTSGVRALQDDEDKISDRAIKMFAAGLITRNRARELSGEEKLDGPKGDVLVMPMNQMEIPADGKIENEVPPKDTGAAAQLEQGS